MNTCSSERATAQSVEGGPGLDVEPGPLLFGVRIDHELKALVGYFQAHKNGRMPFTVRRDDRGGFHEGQHVLLREFNGTESRYTGRAMVFRIGFVTAFEQRAAFVAFALLPLQGRRPVDGDKAVTAGLVDTNVVGEAGLLDVDFEVAEFASRFGDGKTVGLAGMVQEAHPEGATAVERVVIGFDDGKYLLIVGKRVHTLDKAGLQAVLPYVLKYMAKAASVGGA